MEEMEELKKQLSDLRRRYMDKEAEDNEDALVFSGLTFHKNMNTVILDKNDLVLGHVFLHNTFSKKNPKINKDEIKNIHTLFTSEMKIRGLNHKDFDTLDK